MADKIKVEKTIALDFDGVLHSYSRGFTGPVPEDPPVPGSREFVENLIQRGFQVVVHSTRAAVSEAGRDGIVRWLGLHGFPALKVVKEKPKADLYIDDRGFRFKGDFQEALIYIDYLNPGLGTWNRP